MSKFGITLITSYTRCFDHQRAILKIRLPNQAQKLTRIDRISAILFLMSKILNNTCAKNLIATLSLIENCPVSVLISKRVGFPNVYSLDNQVVENAVIFSTVPCLISNSILNCCVSEHSRYMETISWYE